MSEKIGRFEIISQIAQSAFASVYKALDTNSEQTVALKVVRLDQVSDREGLRKRVLDEAEQAKALNSHNIAVLYGVEEDGEQLLAATEYVQGNSVATTLARHDGFSMWDLEDIARQVSQALDHAQVHKVVHHSLEPAKIMVQWDGLVKVLGFGISAMGSPLAGADGPIPEVLYYSSPEQLRGDVSDHRSVLFSLGAILYEMATEHKPFTGETAQQVRDAVLDQLPVQPLRLKANMNRGLSDLIMKALSKNPDDRYPSGQEFVRDLEQCKANPSSMGAAPAKTPTHASRPKVNAAAAAAFAGASPNPAAPPKITASAEAAVEDEKPRIAVDPLMAEDSEAVRGKSTGFSAISELPPLKEVPVDTSFHPSEPEPAEEAPVVEVPRAVLRKSEPEKPRVQVRAAAQKAVKEIRKTPPKLYLTALGGAVALIGIIVGGMMLKNYFEDRDEGNPTNAIQQITGAPSDSTPAAPAAVEPSTPAPAQTAPPAQAPPPAQATAAPEPQPEAQEPEQPEPSRRGKHGKKAKTRTHAAVIPAQLSVSSTPEGADITFDGSALCQSPCTLTGIAPGAHTIVASKNGFASATRNLSLTAGATASISLSLTQSSALLSISSTPAGAVVLIDGSDTGKLTPAQFTVSKPGTHTVTLRRAGFLDGSTAVKLELGQASTVNLSLTRLGSTDEIRAAGGRFKKVFGHGDASGMGIVSVKTQPKGAQIMVNSRVLDKTSPFDFYLNPGTYVLNVTMSGYRPIHRVITVEEGEKVAIEESLQPE